MDNLDALDIIIDLARDNILDEAEVNNIPELEEERKKQWIALETVIDLRTFLYMKRKERQIYYHNNF